MTDLTVANTILSQLGGNKFLCITGARNLTGTASSLSMRLSGRTKAGAVNALRVTLDASDTYTVESFHIRGGKLSPRHKAEGIYCDMLRHEFEMATGLFASF